jgi:hypothetical protein
MNISPRKIGAMTRSEALSLLAGVSMGRIVFTENAMPAVRPASHLVESGVIVVRSHDGSAVVPAAGDRIVVPAARVPGADPDKALEHGTVVAYEADAIDIDSRLGWSVVVTGTAEPVTDPGDIARYAAALPPWTAAGEGQLIRVDPGIVTGYRLLDQPA